MWWNVGVVALVLLNLYHVVKWNKCIASRRYLPKDHWKVTNEYRHRRVVQAVMTVPIVVIGKWLPQAQMSDESHVFGLMFYLLLGFFVPYLYSISWDWTYSTWSSRDKTVGWLFSAKGAKFYRVDWENKVEQPSFTYFLGGFAGRHVDVKSETGQRLDGWLEFWATEETRPDDYKDAVKSSTEQFVQSAQSLLDRNVSVEEIQETLVATFKPNGRLELKITRLRLYPHYIKLVPEKEEAVVT